MIYHVLPGDAQVETFKRTNIEGEIIVCRECLIEGETQAANLENFWKIRAEFVGKTYGEDESEYRRKVVAEFEKLQAAPAGSEINLWFEFELFCQANMWFCLSLLENKNTKIFRVAPVVRAEKDIWKGFGALTSEDLQTCFDARIELSENDVALGAKIWRAFQQKNFDELKTLGAIESAAFPRLAEVCQAAIEKQTRPQKTLREITASGENDFEKIFARFKEREGVYGFGDAQVKNILAAI